VQGIASSNPAAPTKEKTKGLPVRRKPFSISDAVSPAPTFKAPNKNSRPKAAVLTNSGKA